MRIIVILGSGRRHGNTARVVEQTIAHLHRLAKREEQPLHIETIYLAQRDIQSCLGCRLCFDRGEQRCPHKDDLSAIAQSMAGANGLIVAGPVYVDDVSGLTKTWIDRLAYLCHRPALVHHCALAIATSAVSPTIHTLGTMTMALRTWGCCVAGSAGLRMGARWPDDEMEAFTKRTERLARRLYRAIQRKHYERPGLIQLITFAVQQRYHRRHYEDSLDRTYWREQGWLDRGSQYYVKPRNNPLFLWIARALATLIAPLVT